MIVVKIGGSVATKAKDVLSEISEACEFANVRAIIIPGGWIFSNVVRLIDYNVGLKYSNAMAILSMEMYAYYLSSFGYRLVSFDEIKNKYTVSILKPYSILEEIERELPKSWDVTSDSIAIWFAAKIGVKDVVKVTDVDGIFFNGKLISKVSAKKLCEFSNFETCLDRYAPKLIRKYKIRLFICNGKKEGRVKKYILEGDSVGTLIS